MLALGIGLFHLFQLQLSPLPPLPATERAEIARQIYRNECAASPAYLVTWNRGEDFMSLGIGHFIWYPAGARGPFVESFPMLIRFMRARQARLPAWLRSGPVPAAPWPDRTAFMAAARRHDTRITTLRRLLLRTQALQAAFMAGRMRAALPRMLAAAPAGRRAHVRRQFLRLARAPGGYYPLIDYVNFKGEGTDPAERYQGKGWGLMQVLERMHGEGGPRADFADAATALLRQRVRLSPPARHEARWLAGWLKRVDSYRGDSASGRSASHRRTQAGLRRLP